MKSSSLFITFEGGEGAGKTTQIQKISDRLTECGRRNITIRTPGSTQGAETIRSIVKNKSNNFCGRAELMLMCAAMAQTMEEVIRPNIDQGCIVLCDRFYHSSLAYQGYGRQLGEKAVMEAVRLVIDGLMPDLTFYLHIPEGIVKSRIEKRGEPIDRFESAGQEFHNRIRRGYERFADMKRIDGTQTIEAVTEEIWKNIMPLL